MILFFETFVSRIVRCMYVPAGVPRNVVSCWNVVAIVDIFLSLSVMEWGEQAPPDTLTRPRLHSGPHIFNVVFEEKLPKSS